MGIGSSHEPLTAPPRETNESYKPQLDGIRAFCIIFTIFFHLPGRPLLINGSVGVDVFFALSGWLITWLLVQEFERTGGIRLPAFYIRRIFRIVPLYILTVIVYVVLASAGMKATGSSELGAALPYMLTFNMEYRPAAAGNLFGHAWTLGIEEKFYLVWPLILWASIRRPALAMGMAILCVAALFVALGVTPFVERGYSGLGFGAALALIASRRENLVAWLRTHAIAGYLLGVMVVPYALSIVWPKLAVFNILIAMLAAGAIASLWFNDRQRAYSFLSMKPLPWLGRLTYAIYLIQSVVIRAVEAVLQKLHMPLGGIALFLVVYPACIVGAWILHIVVEKPFIRLGRALVKKKGAVPVRHGAPG